MAFEWLQDRWGSALVRDRWVGTRFAFGPLGESFSAIFSLRDCALSVVRCLRRSPGLHRSRKSAQSGTEKSQFALLMILHFSILGYGLSIVINGREARVCWGAGRGVRCGWAFAGWAYWYSASRCVCAQNSPCANSGGWEAKVPFLWCITGGIDREREQWKECSWSEGMRSKSPRGVER